MNVLKKIYKRFATQAIHGGGKDRMPFGEQMAFLRAVGTPGDDYERSYLKYKCFTAACYYHRGRLLFLYNLAAMFALPVYRLKLRRLNRANPVKDQADAVIENVPRLPNTDVIPRELLTQYERKREIHSISYGNAHLNDQGEAIYREVRRRYFGHFYFRLMVLLKLAQFSVYLDSYRPKAVCFYSVEREFESPLQTMLCEAMGARYIAFMHGDYLKSLDFAFQKYSLYYVWDQAYADMFDELQCDFPTRVYRPAKLTGIAGKKEDEDCGYFATYYFSAESEIQVARVQKVFARFEAEGLRIKVRPHPRFSDIPMIQRFFGAENVEDVHEWSLADSIADSIFIVGLNTTVLSEAFFSGKKIVIDDVSAPAVYAELDERGYVSIKREHLLLSELQDMDLSPFTGRCRCEREAR